MRMTVDEAFARADLIVELQRAKRESDAEIKALVARIKERDRDNAFLRQCGIAPLSDSEATACRL